MNFRAGKTGLYTDFDGTYFPFHQEILENQEEPLFSQAARMYDAFSKFINKGKEKFKVIITTGRSLIEMQNVLNFLEKSNLPFPQQKNYILRNGLEEIEAADEGYLKSTKAAQLTESFPSEVKNIVISSFDNIAVYEPETNKNMYHYGKSSFEYLYRKNPSDKYVSISAEDNGTIELAFSSNINTDECYGKIKRYIADNNIQASVEKCNNDKHFYMPYKSDDNSEYSYIPANMIFIRPLLNNTAIDKLKQPKEHVKAIIENNENDLVIAAGDDFNDAEMLNPLNYLDIYGIQIDPDADIEETLSRPDVKDAIKKLPLISIVAGNGRNLQTVLYIKELLDRQGIHKILTAKNPEKDLLNKVKRGMHIYSDINSEYKYNLGIDLYREILK